MMRHARTVSLPVELVLAVSLVAANIHCLARCVDAPCHSGAVAQNAKESKLPPCHRGKSDNRTSEQQLCKFAVLVADTVRNIDSLQPLVPGHDAVAEALEPAILRLTDIRVGFVGPTASLQPPELRLSTVLRL